MASLVARQTPAEPGPPALPVPPAPADEVIAVARRLAERGGPAEPGRPDRPAGRGRSGGRDHAAPPPELVRLARALVVDEHPSAPSWSEADRVLLAAWVAVLIEQQGEDGVQELIAALGPAPG
ncbi:hypothetical protein ACWGB8_06525 [Kitasatospora sp. NPDC054939]